jgi:hypothetical protein
MQMHRGNRIKPSELVEKLATLDVDEGIRIESAGRQMFVNKNASGVFVLQFGSEFLYLDSAKQVLSAIKSKFRAKYTVWAY